MSPQPVLVTGAFGLVGSPLVAQLVAENHRVVATAHHVVKAKLAHLRGVEVRRVDLTEPDQVDALVATVCPSAIVHLAAIIPPQCYAQRGPARAVTVDATASLVHAAAALPSPPRFVYASSIAVHGARNPHRFSDVLTAHTPIAPSDVYGGLKAEAEEIVRSSGLEWSVLRLGGVLPIDARQMASQDGFYLGALLPADGRLQTIDVRDVAGAFSAALTTDAVREVFMIAGDDSHRRLQGEVSQAIAAAIGLGRLPPGRPGNPDSDRDWFPTDWMDTARSQEVLSYQQHTWEHMLADMRAESGWKRYPLRLAAPVIREVVRRRSPYHRAPGGYADPWGAIRAKWGAPEPDRTPLDRDRTGLSS